MSCNYFKLFLFSIVLCILIITHKFSHENICYNKTNSDNVINRGYKRLLAEAQETDIFKTHSGENAFTYSTDTKLDENDTEHHKTSSDCTLNNEIREEHDNQTEQVELENENNNKLMIQKSHKKLDAQTIYTRLLLLCGFPLSAMVFITYYLHKKVKKNKQYKKSIHEDQVCMSGKNIDGIYVN